MAISVEEVRYFAELARLRFSEEEEERLARQMSSILGYMEQLNELDTTALPPMSHVLDLYNVFREDEVSSRVSREEVLAVAPEADGSYFRVPKVIE